ncbi:hypothetical protein G7092_14630 [Mucilaginibacter sp. HC2]|uniref:hypothetical protein n=1 Tax=Mucilaginibacter inviolabilis TaxID=2714892 RepID=UPI00140C8DBE|nr:hypothetical protein [Mucilaginibacter inviolabilis]NHA05042.1 hypothetical protein [Mucilaginibacter inviolabilis]
MKKLQLIAAIGILLSVTACRFGKRHTTIMENGNGTTVKIEYVGQTFFTADGTGIQSISPNGYVKYSRDGKQLIAESDHYGKITYEVNDGGKQTMLNDGDKEFLAQAVKDMIKHGHNADGR